MREDINDALAYRISASAESFNPTKKDNRLQYATVLITP
jgi:hypothetical protein